ncbi:hypothetical protein D9615_002625 [Tricholomella constricta]|uniref:Uncharacterized protein n=1 Tax=Tricholomella constricta TaxID=117010 RepID=A0A8H5HM40_9AGAR|nr:hypothetical protein D9615_002625 [Tricholomella constricta]
MEDVASFVEIPRILREIAGFEGEVSSLPCTVSLLRLTFAVPEDVVETSAILGTGDSAGADEDDFHTFKRQKNELDRDEKREEKMKRPGNLNTGVGVVKVSGKLASVPSKKVVHF